jgi:hypothetical protein
MTGVGVGWIKANWFLLLVLATLAGAFFLLRSQPSDVGSLDELNTMLAGGRPTVVTFYSNF